MRDKWGFIKEFVKQERDENPYIPVRELTNKVVYKFSLSDKWSIVQQAVYKTLRDIGPSESVTTSKIVQLSSPEPTASGKDIVGVIGDTHEPFTHPEYLSFCIDTFRKYGVTRVVHIGDEVDNHGLNYHEKHIDAMGATDETNLAQKRMERWYAAFPNVTVIVGNHGALPHRKATTAGIPKKFIKSYEESWKSPAGWKWEMETVIDNVLYVHGIGCTGATGAVDKAIRSRQSVVIGHLHSFGGVNYHASNNDLIFGMNVGCGIDVKTYAFEYGKNFNNKPTLGCGIVVEGHQAVFVPMSLGSKYVYLQNN